MKPQFPMMCLGFVLATSAAHSSGAPIAQKRAAQAAVPAVCSPATDFASVDQATLTNTFYGRGENPARSFRMVSTPTAFEMTCPVTMLISDPSDEGCKDSEKIFPKFAQFYIYGTGPTLKVAGDGISFSIQGADQSGGPVYGTNDRPYVSFKLAQGAIGNQHSHTLFFYLANVAVNADNSMPKAFYMEDFDDTIKACNAHRPDKDRTFKTCDKNSSCPPMQTKDIPQIHVRFPAWNVRGKIHDHIVLEEGEVGSGTEHKP